MVDVKQLGIKNETYYFYNDMINLKNFDSNLLKIDNIYYIGYITDKNASKHKTNEH